MRSYGLVRPIILVAVSVCFFLTGCTKVQVPVLKDAKVASFRMKGLTSAELEIVMKVDNPNNRSVSVEKLTGSLRYENGDPLAVFVLQNPPLSAPAASTSSLNAVLQVTLTDPLALLNSGMDFRNLDMDAFLIDADVSATLGGIKKKFRLNGYPARNVASYLKQ